MFVTLLPPMAETIAHYPFLLPSARENLLSAFGQWFSAGAESGESLHLICPIPGVPPDVESCFSAFPNIRVKRLSVRPEIAFLHHLLDQAPDDTFTIVPPPALVLPIDILSRLTALHNAENNSITIFSDAPANAKIIALSRSLLSWVEDVLPASAVSSVGQLVQLCQKLTQERLRDTPAIKIGQFSMQKSYGCSAFDIPAEVPYYTEEDRSVLLDHSPRIRAAPMHKQIEAMKGYKVALSEAQELQYTRYRKVAHVKPRRRRPKVLFVTSRSGFAGAEEALCTLISGLRLRVNAVACTSIEGLFSQRLRSVCATVEVANFDLSRLTLRTIEWMLSLIDRVKPDIIHFNGNCGIGLLVAVANRGIPSVLHVRTVEGVEFGEYGRYCSKIIVVSEAVKRVFCGANIPPEKTQVIYDSVGPEYFSPCRSTPAAIKRELNLEAQSQLVLTVARYDRNKRHDIVVESVSSLLGDYPELVFVSVGDPFPDGSWYSHVSSLAVSRLGHSNCRILPYRADVRSLMQAAEALVLCSDREALGLAALEAMALSVPVIVSESCGVSELIENGRSGFLALSNSVESVASALRTLLSDAANTERIGINGKEMVTTRLRPEIISEQVVEIYRSMLVL